MEKLRMMYEDPGLAMTAEFHRAFDCPQEAVPLMPKLEDDEVEILAEVGDNIRLMALKLRNLAASRPGSAFQKMLVRVQGHLEETGELADAMSQGNLVGVLDALTDTQYFLDGTYLTFGLAEVKAAAYREVHASNMTKLPEDGVPLKEPSGRVIKGPKYRRPDLARVLADAALARAEKPARSSSLVEPWL